MTASFSLICLDADHQPWSNQGNCDHFQPTGCRHSLWNGFALLSKLRSDVFAAVTFNSNAVNTLAFQLAVSGSGGHISACCCAQLFCSLLFSLLRKLLLLTRWLLRDVSGRLRVCSCDVWAFALQLCLCKLVHLCWHSRCRLLHLAYSVCCSHRVPKRRELR